MGKFLAVAMLMLFCTSAQAGVVLYEGQFSGQFPDGSDIYSLSATWTVSVDDAPPIVGTSSTTTKEGVVTSLIVVVKTPSPGAPIPIPYPNIGTCSDCKKKVTLTFTLGELTGLTIGESVILAPGGAETGFGFQALYQADRSLLTLAYAIEPQGDDVVVPVQASQFFGSFREVPGVPEPAISGLIVVGLSATALTRRRRRKISNLR